MSRVKAFTIVIGKANILFTIYVTPAHEIVWHGGL